MGEARGLTARVVLLSVLLSALYTIVNTYLNVNFGMGFGFSAITILLAYGLFHKLGGASHQGSPRPSRRSEAKIIKASVQPMGSPMPAATTQVAISRLSEPPPSLWKRP